VLNFYVIFVCKLLKDALWIYFILYYINVLYFAANLLDVAY